MNTPMQILIDQLKDLYDYDLREGKRNWAILAGIELAQELIEKEKEAIMNAYDIGWSDGNKDQDLNDLYYNETFNTNQKNLPDSTNGYTYYPQEHKTTFNTKEE